MAIWDFLLKKAVDPLIQSSIEQYKKEQEEIERKVKEEKVEKGLMVLEASNRSYYPASDGKKTGQLFAKNTNFKNLRSFSLYYPILRACINYRKRQITSLSWDITSSEVNLKTNDKSKNKEVEAKTDQDKKDIKIVKDFLKYPSGDKINTFRSFVTRIIEDAMVLDAVAVARRRNLKGGIFGYQPIDATTIELVLREDGTVPMPPEKAYVQKIGGKMVAELTTDELIYRMMNPRTNTPYGLSPVESLVLTVTTALKLSSYNLSYLTEGNIPEGLVELPKDVASNQEQLKAWQEAWDAMFSGNPKYTRRVKFLPEGMKWTPLKKTEDMEFERFEKWLLLQTCAILEVPPQAIGFQFDRGKGATEAEWEIGKERGLYPLANFIKEIMDQIIQEDLGMPHLEFAWQNINPTNKKEEADVFKSLVSTGAVSVDEWRLGEGLPPIGLPQYIMTPVGPILVKDFVDASEEGTPLIPYNYTQGGANPAVGGNGKKPEAPSTGTVNSRESVRKPTGYNAPDKNQDKKDPPKNTKKYSDEELIDELKRWRKVVVKDFKSGIPFRDFRSDIIDARTQRLVKDGLRTVKNREELDELFNPLISQDNKIITDVLNMYEDISRIANGNKSSEII